VLPNAWDFALPLYILLSLVLIRVVVRATVTPWTLLACLVAGVTWDWAGHAWGVVPAAALAILLALTARAVLRRVDAGGWDR
jgi:hypothetical protein